MEPLYTSWQPDQKFVADANIGVFRSPHLPPIVPDMFLSLDVEIHENWYAQAQRAEHRSYFLWEFGKPPDAIIEVVSNRKGGEAGKKLIDYARIGIAYYAIYDPLHLIQDEALQVYDLHAGRYVRKENNILDEIGLGLTLWDGEYEAKETIWLRWCDLDGVVLPTGAEAVRQAQSQAKQAQHLTERLAEQLRALGVNPEA